MDVYARLKELGLELGKPTPAGGIYSPVRFYSEKMVYTSGTGGAREGLLDRIGRVGRDLTIEEGQEMARRCVMNLLANLHAATGDLNKIKRMVKMLVFVNSAEDFFQQPQVANGASKLLLDVFGEEAGLPARSAIGVHVLPGNIPVEIELLLELK